MDTIQKKKELVDRLIDEHEFQRKEREKIQAELKEGKLTVDEAGYFYTRLNSMKLDVLSLVTAEKLLIEIIQDQKG